MLVACIDFEASSLDTASARILEAACVLWDTDLDAPVEFYSSLVTNPIIDPETTKRITGITVEMVDRHGKPASLVFSQMLNYLGKAERVLGHNIRTYDGFLFENECKREGIALPPMKIVDTMTDIIYPESMTSKKLVYLASDHGVRDQDAHRALADTLMTLRIFRKYPLWEILQRADEARYHVSATIPPPWFDKSSPSHKDIAKAAGFHGSKVGNEFRWEGIFLENQVKTWDLPFRTVGTKIRQPFEREEIANESGSG